MPPPVAPAITLVRPCPICGHRQAACLAPLRYELFDQAPVCGTFGLASCASCGFSFYDTPSSQADFDEYYAGNVYYFSATSTGNGGTTTEDMRRFGLIEERLRKYVSKNSAIYDVGCAKGGLLLSLRERGYANLHGIDMLPQCVEHVRTAVGAQAGVGSVHSIPFPDGQADLLMYSQVAEHVVDLSRLIDVASSKLKDGGLVYMEVPDAANYGAHAAAPYYFLLLEHINHFDRDSLVSLFARKGFGLVETGTGHVDAEPARWPVVWGIFRKGGTTHTPPVSRIDERLSAYVRASESHPVMTTLASLAQQQCPVHVWGISLYTYLLLGQTPLRDCAIAGLVDKNPHKQTKRLLGRPVQSPEVLRGLGSGHAVVVAALGFEKQIAESLVGMGFAGRVVFLT